MGHRRDAYDTFRSATSASRAPKDPQSLSSSLSCSIAEGSDRVGLLYRRPARPARDGEEIAIEILSLGLDLNPSSAIHGALLDFWGSLTSPDY